MVNLSELVDFVWSWLNEWEIRELERMFAKHTPSVREMARTPKAERRVDLEKRRRVAEMSPHEMARELLTSEVTGLPNRRAFDEAEVASAVAMSDLDGLKAVNDSYGYRSTSSRASGGVIASNSVQRRCRPFRKYAPLVGNTCKRSKLLRLLDSVA